MKGNQELRPIELGNADDPLDTPIQSNKALFFGMSWTSATQVWSMVITLVTTPYLLHHLGTEVYGLLIVATIATNYLWFVDCGIGIASIKYISESVANDEPDRTRKIYWTALAAYSVISLAIALALAAAAPFIIDRAFAIPGTLRPDAISVIWFTAVSFGFGLANRAPSAALTALRRFGTLSITSALAITLRSLVAVLLVWAKYTIVGITIGYAVVSVAVFVFNLGIAHYLLKPGYFAFDRGHFKLLLRYGSSLSLTVAVGSALQHTDKLLMSHFAGLSNLTFFAIPANLWSRVWSIPIAMRGVLLPAFGALPPTAAKETAQLLSTGTRWIGLFMVPASTILFIFAHPILELWLGVEVASASAPILKLMSAAYLLWSLFLPYYSALEGFAKPDLLLAVQVIVGIVYLPALVILIRTNGIIGGAFAFEIRVVCESIGLLVAFKSVCPFAIRHQLRTALKLLCLFTIMILPPMLFQSHTSLSPFILFSTALWIIIIYPIGSYSFVLVDSEKHRVSQFLSFIKGVPIDRTNPRS